MIKTIISSPGIAVISNLHLIFFEILDLSLKELMCIYKVLINHPEKLQEMLTEIQKSKEKILDVQLRNTILEQRLKYYASKKTVD